MTTQPTPEVEADTQELDAETPKIEAKRQKEAENVDAWEKASDARIAADRAVEKLKRLWVKASATQEQIDAAKKKVASRKIKANKLEIAAIFADDDAQAAAQQMASPIHEPTPIHDCSLRSCCNN